MKAVRMTITQTEKELLAAVGFVTVNETLTDDTMKVLFSFARWLNMQELMHNFESAIEFQESSRGNRCKAKEWRAAESGLKDKIRVAYMRIYKDEEADNEQV